MLDYEEDENGSKKKKPWRYRWPDDFRDEVLARLLEMNKQRAEAERLAGAEAALADSKGKPAAPRASGAKKAKKPSPPSGDLFE